VQGGLLCLAGVDAEMGWPYYAGVLAFGCHMLRQINTVDLDNGRDCMDKFVSNKYAGALLMAGCLGGRLLQ
jgi:4-hydroxybenzoate polyprenyltransferase